VKDVECGQMQQKLKSATDEKEQSQYISNKDGMITFRDIIYISHVPTLKQLILEEHQRKPFLAHTQ